MTPCSLTKLSSVLQEHAASCCKVISISYTWTLFAFPPFPYGATAPNGPGLPHYRGFTITLRHTPLGRTPLDEWSVRRRDRYLTTHNNHKRQTSMSLAGPVCSRERSRTLCIMGWLGLRVSLEGYGKSRPPGVRTPDCLGQIACEYHG
jgi:hypothetical protein